MNNDVREIRVYPIASRDANRLVKKIHYSGTYCRNSCLHFGVFLNNRCGGVLQFGPSVDKRKTIGLVRGTKWSEFMELNRMAFDDWLPRNSESRAIGYCLRLLKREYRWLKWILSYADGTQCGDGTIYRASGFVLTGINKNKTILRLPNGQVITDKTLNNEGRMYGRGAAYWLKHGAAPLQGFQLRYIYFLHQEERKNLMVPEIPFSEIKEMGAGMYRGKKR